MKAFLAKRNITTNCSQVSCPSCLYSSGFYRRIFKFSLVSNFFQWLLTWPLFWITVYLTGNEDKRVQKDDLVSPKTRSTHAIGLTGFMSIICLYTGAIQQENLQQLIALYWCYSLLDHHASAHVSQEYYKKQLAFFFWQNL